MEQFVRYDPIAKKRQVCLKRGMFLGVSAFLGVVCFAQVVIIAAYLAHQYVLGGEKKCEWAITGCIWFYDSAFILLVLFQCNGFLVFQCILQRFLRTSRQKVQVLYKGRILHQCLTSQIDSEDRYNCHAPFTHQNMHAPKTNAHCKTLEIGETRLLQTPYICKYDVKNIKISYANYIP